MNEDLYKLLGLQRNASLEEIKRAYRQLAKQHHPDRTQNNPQDTEIFKAVAVAFATLSNPQKRAEYDRTLAAKERRSARVRAQRTQTSTSGPRQSSSPFDDILGEFFPEWSNWSRERNERLLEVTLSKEEAEAGVTVPVDLPWKDQCLLCQGTGLAPFSICRGCRGSGLSQSARRFMLTIPAGVTSGTTQRLCLTNNYLTILVRIKVR